MNIKKILPIIGILIFLYIIINLDINEIFSAFSKINPIYSFLAFFSVVPIILLSNIQWQILLKKQKIRVSFWYSIKNMFIGYFYGFISPGGIGAYTRALYLQHESKSPLPKCISNIIIFNTLDYITLLLFGAVGAIFLSSKFHYLFFVIIIVLSIVFALFFFFFNKEKSKIIFIKLVKSRIFSTVKDRLENSIDSFYEDLPKFRDVLIPFSLSIIGWILRFTELFLISKLFGFDIPFFYFILILAVANVISSIPISIYGLGTREASLISLFTIFNVVAEDVVSLSLFWFAVIWLTPSIFGAIVTFFETKKFNEFELNQINVEKFQDYMKKYPELYQNLAEIVKKYLPKKVKKPVIVDLGTGPGLLSLELAKKIPEAKIIGVDPSKYMLKIAKRNVSSKNFNISKGISHEIPLEDNSVDLLVTRFTLTYWEKPIESFKEINRILKTDGKVVFECLNKDFPKWKLFIIKIQMHLRSASSNIIKYHINAYKTAYNYNSVKTLFNKSKFEIIYEEIKEKEWKFLVVAEKK